MAPFRPSSMAMRPQALCESKALDGDRSEAMYFGPTPPTSPEQDIPEAKAEIKSPSTTVLTGQAVAQATATMNPCAVAFTPAHSPPVTIPNMSKGSRSSFSRSRNSVKPTEQEHVSVAQRSEAVILSSPRLEEDIAITSTAVSTTPQRDQIKATDKDSGDTLAKGLEPIVSTAKHTRTILATSQSLVRQATAGESTASAIDLQHWYQNHVDSFYPTSSVPNTYTRLWYSVPMMPLPQDICGQCYIPVGHPMLIAPFPQPLSLGGTAYGCPPVPSPMMEFPGAAPAANVFAPAEVVAPSVRPHAAAREAGSTKEHVVRQPQRERLGSALQGKGKTYFQKGTFSVGTQKSEWPKPCEAAAREGGATRRIGDSVASPNEEALEDGTTRDSRASKRTSEATDTVNQPPPNAPTGPKALRKSRFCQGEPQELSSKITNESGSWTQSAGDVALAL